MFIQFGWISSVLSVLVFLDFGVGIFSMFMSQSSMAAKFCLLSVGRFLGKKVSPSTPLCFILLQDSKSKWHSCCCVPSLSRPPSPQSDGFCFNSSTRNWISGGRAAQQVFLPLPRSRWVLLLFLQQKQCTFPGL